MIILKSLLILVESETIEGFTGEGLTVLRCWENEWEMIDMESRGAADEPQARDLERDEEDEKETVEEAARAKVQKARVSIDSKGFFWHPTSYSDK